MNETNFNELLDCPFCGGSNTKHAIYMSSGCIECNDCGAIGPDVTPDYDIELAEAAWNKRASTLKDHVIAAMVNELTAATPAYAEAQSLREVISRIVNKHIKNAI